MGIKQIETYQVTEHAKQRLHERFMTTSSHITAWLLAFNKRAEKIQDQSEGKQLWRSNDVFMAIKPSSKTILTVYLKSEHVDIEDVVTNEQVQVDLEQMALGKIKHKQIQFGADMYVPLMNLDLLAHQLRFGDDVNNVSELYEKLVSGIDRVVEQRDKANAYLMDMQKLIK
ncbi:hypothetical protein [Weissella minor]|uniref:hypothetical protein n=1 Tax=Weissella minor TaxID=1620 RepID=UPI003AF1FAC1